VELEQLIIAAWKLGRSTETKLSLSIREGTEPGMGTEWFLRIQVGREVGVPGGTVASGVGVAIGKGKEGKMEIDGIGIGKGRGRGKERRIDIGSESGIGTVIVIKDTRMTIGIGIG